MNATTPQTLIQRATAVVLATVVTLGVLGGIDALATHNVQANALLVQQGAVSVTHG